MDEVDFLGAVAELSIDSSLGLSFLSGQQYQFLHIVFESVYINLHLLSRFIGSSMVDHNSDGSCELNVDSDGLDLLESEPSSQSGFGRVPLSGLPDNWSQSLDWSWEDGLGLFLSFL